jgi:catechol 2,3-dioxygenase-like lactoylglutathione lyase family enzyme
MKILEIEIQTDNIKETETFYSEILGLQLVNKNQNSISFKAGQSKLTFIKSDNINPRYHFAFNIPNNKLEEAILWAKSRLSLIENDENGIIANFESWNANAIYFYDNNNNIVEFIARFDLENSTEKPFDISVIESISEIGIVTDKPLDLAETLIESYNLVYFNKSTKSEKFAALGNDNGLFIIVETNRKWYPTEQKAKKYFSRIKIEVDSLVKEFKLNEIK